MPTVPEAFDPKTLDVQEKSNLKADGDSRGKFGYGRPAHGSDPNAQYEFADAADKLADPSHAEGDEGVRRDYRITVTEEAEKP